MNKHKIYLRIAREASLLSKDPKAKIGAVALSKGRIVSVGVNGYPSGYNDADVTNKHDKVIHAEMNAILNHGGNPKDIDTVYVYGLPPCSECMKMLAAIGVKYVAFYIDEKVRSHTEWLDQFRATNQLHTIEFDHIKTLEE
jgi:dCMP deaminase